jgi:HEPN domain-containing protein
LNGWRRPKKISFQRREYRARKRPNYNAACFFSQQCIEKYIKARLQEEDIVFGKIHDLVELLELVSSVEPLWDSYRPTFRPITAYAVNYRYPGENATREEAQDVIKICKGSRDVARQSPGLDA